MTAMTATAAWALLLLLPLALITGANYGGKAVGLWWASGRISLPRGLAACAVVMALGGVASLLLAQDLTALYRGIGMGGAAAGQLTVPQLALCAGAAATAVMAAASWRGWPISSTHAITGALLGGLWMAGAGAEPATWARLMLPLALGPVVGFAVALALRRLHPGPPSVQPRWRPLLHACVALTLAFAAGYNNAPKVAALLGLAGGPKAALHLALGIAPALLLGGLLSARVARRVGTGLADVDDRRSAQAAGIGAVLTVAGASLALPLSLTHVVCGAALGAGRPHWMLFMPVAAAWLLTLPLAFLGAAALVHFV
jgi:PiT family inorganic phosphate transporter